MTEVPPPPPHTSTTVSSNEILSDPTTNYLNQKTYYGTDRASFPPSLLHLPRIGILFGLKAILRCRIAGMNEANRIEMNVRQPAGMWNYTTMGFRLAST
jgi:hypothetical protein